MLIKVQGKVVFLNTITGLLGKWVNGIIEMIMMQPYGGYELKSSGRRYGKLNNSSHFLSHLPFISINTHQEDLRGEKALKIHGMSEIRTAPGQFKISSLVIVSILNFWESRAPKDSEVKLAKPNVSMLA